jgi:hypothetical protein
MKQTGIIIGLLFLIMWSTSGYAQVPSEGEGQFSFPTLAEETKLTRDVYVALGNKWGKQIFTNIQQAKEKHLDEVKKLIQQRGLELPEAVVNDEQGTFSDPQIQKWYDNLVSEGSTSLEAAFKVGAMIAERDIIGLETGLEVEIDEKETTLLNKLLNASQNHLRAFHKGILKQGVDYEPVLMDKAAFDTVIQGEKAMNCQGNGKMGKAKMGNGKMGGCKGNCKGKCGKHSK